MKAFKLFLKITFLLTGLILLNSTCLLAASITNKYQVYLTQFELYNSDTRQWVTVYTGTSVTLDIASQSGSGVLIGNFLSGQTVPDGNYTKAKATPSTTFVIRGSVTGLGGPYYTTGTTASSGGRTVCVPSTIAGDEAECTTVMLSTDVTPPLGGVTFTGGTLTVTNGVPNKRVRVYFDLSDALTWDGTYMYPGPPTITIELVSN